MMLSVKPRVTMCSRVFLCLIGVLYIYCEVFVAQDIYIAELMVESNVTLEAEAILTNLPLEITLTDGKTVTIIKKEPVAECLIVGDKSDCNCSSGYIWSNVVCYEHKCCRETTCTANVSHITPLCIPKVKVRINGSVTLSTSWTEVQTTKLTDAFKKLNGFDSLNITGQRLGNTVADFEAAVSVKMETAEFQRLVVDPLEASLPGVVLIDTEGMVHISSTAEKACYNSTVTLTCTFEEETGSAGWNMSNENGRFELNDGSVVKLLPPCSTTEYKSCTKVKLNHVTGIWEGTYECGFTSKSIRHTAKKYLQIALLPDEIILEIDPLSVDCSTDKDTVKVHASATINSTGAYKVSWKYMIGETQKKPSPSEGYEIVTVKSFSADVSCQKTPEPQYFSVSFENSLNQVQSARVDIPVIYEGQKFCDREELLNGEIWPKTPSEDTVINRKCPQGRVGYKSRTCKGTTWEPVFSSCVSVELNKVLGAADSFYKGQGATQEVAKDIFEGLKNTSSFKSDSGDAVADITASIRVLGVMSSASKNVALKEDVFPDFVDASSNMLDNSWESVNTSVRQSMSSNYLQSVEGLVKNIVVNNSQGVNSSNIELKFCSGANCTVSVFDVNVNLNRSDGIVKTFVVKNLTDRLRNTFRHTTATSLIVSATLASNTNSTIDITLDFPTARENSTKPYCVFWDTPRGDWSDKGCTVKTSDVNRTVCECEHLTAFSVLMAKGDISDGTLEIITNVGLGMSVCSLIIFLLIEFLVWSAVVKSNLSHFRHTALVNIAVFLLLADCCFLASSSPEKLGGSWCLILTICKHLFFLAMFSWMLCMSVMLVHQLIFVFSPLRKRVFMFISSIVGYVCPILIVGSSYIYCKYTEKDYYKKDTCWLVYDRLLEGSIHAFLLPVGTIMLTNLFSMVVVILTLMKTSVPDSSKTDDKETAKSILKVVVFLTPVFGVTWIIGFFLLILEEDDPMHTVANYSFTILNSFQGVFLLITGCFAEQKVREQLLKLIMAKTKGRSESMRNLTSATYTKDK